MLPLPHERACGDSSLVGLWLQDPEVLQPGSRVGSIIGERPNLRTPSKLRMGSALPDTGLDMSDAGLQAQAHAQAHVQASEALAVQTAAAQVCRDGHACKGACLT